MLCCHKSKTKSIQHKEEIKESLKMSQMQQKTEQVKQGKLYLITALIKPSPYGGKELTTILKQINCSLQSDCTSTNLLYSFKVTGESKIYAVFEVNSLVGFERRVAGLSSIGNIEVMCEALIPYEEFAKSMGLGDFSQVPFRIGNGEDLFCLEFNINKFSISTTELGAIWAQEAKFMFKKREEDNMNIILYKVVGQRKMMVFVQETPETTDMLSFNIPLMKLAGGIVDLKCRSIQDLSTLTKNITS